MNYEQFKLNDLKTLIPEKYIEYKEKLYESINNHGVISPIVIANNYICDGHKRFIISKKLGFNTIPAIFINGDPIELLFELNDRDFNINILALLSKNLSDSKISKICDNAGLSSSPQMIFALKYLSSLLEKNPELFHMILPSNIWRELGHLENDIDKYAYDLITMQGTVGEKRNIVAFLRQAKRRNELPASIKAEKATDILPILEKATQPRRTEAYEKYENALGDIDLPKSANIKIDPTFSQPGVTVTLSVIRSELDKIEQTKQAIEKLFNKVPEL